MARQKKEKVIAFYDQFYAMPVDEQAIALRILEEHHRLAAKTARKGRVASSDLPGTSSAGTGAAE